MRRFIALLLSVPALAGWFWHEWIKEVFWDKVLHVLSPENSSLLEYGPPAIFAGIVIYLLVGNKQRSRIEMLSIAMMIIGALAFVGGILLYRGETGKFPLSAEKEGGKEKQVKSPPTETLEEAPILYIECKRQQATAFPESGRIYILMISPNLLSSMTGGFGTADAIPGSDATSINNRSNEVFQCKVTNYGTYPVFNVYLWAHIAYFSKDKKQAMNFEATPIAQTNYPLTLNAIDPGISNQFVFYIVNVSGEGGFFNFLSDIKYNVPNQTQKRKGIINQPEPRYSRMVLIGNTEHPQ